MTNIRGLVIIMQKNTSVSSNSLLIRVIEFTHSRNRLFLILVILFCAVIVAAAPLAVSSVCARIDSAWNDGWRAWRADDAQAALECWSRHPYIARIAPRPARLCYWRVRALEKLGRYYEAEALRLRTAKLYPTDYYTYMLYPDGGCSVQFPDSQTKGDSFKYPRPWSNYVVMASKSTGISDITIWSVMRRESKFRAGSVSRSGAVGLMQLMPATAADIAKRMGFKLTNLKEPSQNIMLGAGYYAHLNRKFNGDIIRTVAAYNAGAGTVSSWASLSAADWAEWVECIPYRETREFVRSVLENRETYRIIYNGHRSDSLYSFMLEQPLPFDTLVLSGEYPGGRQK